MPVALDIVEFQGTGSLDSSTTASAQSGNTTLSTNGITTVTANTVLVALFEARHGSTPVTLSTPGTGFTQCQANDQAAGDTVCTTNYITYQVVFSVQTNVSTNCASSPAASRTQGVLLAYAQAVSSLTMSARKRKRPWRRFPRRPGRRPLPATIQTITALFPFPARRRHKRRPKAFGHHKRWFWGDITPIAPQGQCFTITVSEQLGASILIEEYLAATAVELERRSATILATERLSARAVISERLVHDHNRLLPLGGKSPKLAKRGFFMRSARMSGQ